MVQGYIPEHHIYTALQINELGAELLDNLQHRVRAFVLRRQELLTPSVYSAQTGDGNVHRMTGAEQSTVALAFA
ncbi:hypothetical protein D3C75_702210 [compost metagenome]